MAETNSEYSQNDLRSVMDIGPDSIEGIRNDIGSLVGGAKVSAAEAWRRNINGMFTEMDVVNAYGLDGAQKMTELVVDLTSIIEPSSNIDPNS